MPPKNALVGESTHSNVSFLIPQLIERLHAFSGRTFPSIVVNCQPERNEKTKFILQKDKEWRNEFQYTSRLRSNLRIVISTCTSFFGQARILLWPRFLEIPRYSEEPIGQRTKFGHGSTNPKTTFGFRISKSRMVSFSLCGVQETARNMFLVEHLVVATSWNQPSIQRLWKAPFVFEDSSHLCILGVKDPRSRRALKRPVRYLTNTVK